MLSHPIPWAEAERLGWPTLSVSESRDVDRIAMEEYGVAGIDLMRRAGEVCARRLLRGSAETEKPFLILAGAGNNGGDGYVIARHLAGAGRQVRVAVLAPLAKLTGDALQSYQDASGAGVRIDVVDADVVCQRIGTHQGVIVDCLLGTGTQGAPRSPFAEAIRAANAVDRCSFDAIDRVAIDIPSGLDGDTGKAQEPTFRADLTLTFVSPKTGMKNPTAGAFLGEVEIVDIGIPEELKRQLGVPGPGCSDGTQ